ELAVRAVEHIEESVSIGPHHELAGSALPLHIREDGNLRRVKIEFVMWRELVMPLQLARVDVERNDGTGVEIVAGAIIAVPVRARVSNSPVREVEVGIIRSGDPDGSTAVLRG